MLVNHFSALLKGKIIIERYLNSFNKIIKCVSVVFICIFIRIVLTENEFSE